MGKGSKRRRSTVPRKEFEENWDAIFSKKSGQTTNNQISNATINKKGSK